MTTSTTALITGASSGIGMELARIHAKKGGDLVLVARSKDKLENLKAELESTHKVSATVIVEDLSEANAARDLARNLNVRSKSGRSQAV